MLRELRLVCGCACAHWLNVYILGVCACMRVRVHVYMPVCMHAMCTCGVCECIWVCAFGAGGI